MSNVSYIEPLSKAWERTGRILFAPFDLTKWFTLGFITWLAAQTAFYIPSFNFSFPTGQTAGWPVSGYGMPSEMGAISAVIAVFVAGFFLLVILSIALIVLWVNSRAKLIFLHNIVHNQTCIIAPWNTLTKQGNSLFFWRIGFLSIYLLVFGMLTAICLLTYATHLQGATLRIPVIIVSSTLLFTAIALVIIFLYTTLLLEDFVIPLMYKHRLSCSKAWYIFLPVFKVNLLAFILYGLLKGLLAFIIQIMLLALMIGSCCLCCSGMVLMIPYVGTVILLPIPVFFRTFSLYFLAQFGSDYDGYIADKNVWNPNPPPLPGYVTNIA